jgi:hypothetical protein
MSYKIKIVLNKPDNNSIINYGYQLNQINKNYHSPSNNQTNHSSET